MKYDNLSKKKDKLRGACAQEILNILTIDGSSNLHQIVRITKRNKSNVCRDLRKLIKLGLVKRLSSGYYVVVKNTRGIPPRGPSILEAHGIQVEIHLKYEEKKNAIRGLFKSNKFSKGQNFKIGQPIYKDNMDGTIQSSNKGWLYSLPKGYIIYADDLNQLTENIYQELVDRSKKIFRAINMPIDLEKGLRIELMNCHVVCRDENLQELLRFVRIKKITIVDSDTGRQRFKVDFSQGYREAECVEPSKSLIDAGEFQELVQTFLFNGKYKELTDMHKLIFPRQENALSYALLNRMQELCWTMIVANMARQEELEKTMSALIKIEKTNSLMLQKLTIDKISEKSNESSRNAGE